MTVVTAVSILVVPWDQDAVIGGFYRERFARGSLTRGLVTRPNVPLLWAHQQDRHPIGMFDPESWQDHPIGMVGLALLDTSDPDGRLAGDKVRGGWVVGASIGFIPRRARWQTSAMAWDPDNPDSLDLCTRLEAEMIEVSLTPTPAYPGARVVGHSVAADVA